MMLLELALAAVALGLALALRPWRLLRGRPALLTPLLATLVVLPWLWALPALHRMPLQLQWSGAVLVLLMLGWPLAVPTLLAVGVLAWAISPMTAEAALAQSVWQGVVPATLASSPWCWLWPPWVRWCRHRPPRWSADGSRPGPTSTRST